MKNLWITKETPILVNGKFDGRFTNMNVQQFFNQFVILIFIYLILQLIKNHNLLISIF